METSFEENLEMLNKIVENLEGGNLPLKEATEKFEKGIEIIKSCYEELQHAELRITTVIKKDGKIITQPFEKTKNG